MGRYIVTIIWSVIYMMVIGFIAAPLTQSVFEPKEALLIGIVFGILFAIIIPTITAHSHKDKSKYSNLK
ncbi:YjzD family protein [Lactobacillus agrestimuris]|uniref:YjzD family protein n=1 Tax=Lactobacillus agrestimuris TaxID=2941328 RepID=UPI0019BB92FB|nr:YjzD family protein [Lactobacillus agrestimuris]MBD5431018.1 YjzD family protein [Lactobacillus sp.]